VLHASAPARLFLSGLLSALVASAHAGTVETLAGTLAEREIRALAREKDSRGDVARKIDSHLSAAAEEERALRVRIRALSARRRELERLRARRLVVEAVDPARGIVEGRVRARDVAQLAALPFVVAIRPVHQGRLRAGSVTTEGDAAAGADVLRGLGYDGSGTTVGVISDGIDAVAQAENSADLPPVEVPSGCGKGHGDEGTALLEIVHDLAPGARLLFSQGISSSLGFVRSVQCLAAAGADVIVDDIGFFDEPYFADGAVAVAVRAAVEAGVSYHTAAGNEADAYLEQTYRAAASGGLHDFLGGPEDTTDDMLVPPSGTLTCFLQWDDPFGAATNDYDLFLFDDALHLLDAGTSSQTGTQDPFEFVATNNPGASPMAVKIVIRKTAGEVRRLKMFCPGGREQEYVSPSGSIFGHPALSEVVSVGAIDVADAGLDDVEFFSSRGPATIAFPAMEIRNKPDLAGFDGVRISNAGGFPRCPPECRFFGTSAAAPHAAATAALLLAKNPFLVPARIRDVLRATAVDIGPPGFDDVAGAGRLDAFAAAAAVDAPECRRASDCDDADACTTDACPEGTCSHARVSCGMADTEGCTDNVCERTRGCTSVDMMGFAGVACWLDGARAALEGASPLEAAPPIRRRLVRLAAAVSRRLDEASAAARAGRAGRVRAGLRGARRRLVRLARALRTARRHARVTARFGERIDGRVRRARELLRPLLPSYGGKHWARPKAVRSEAGSSLEGRVRNAVGQR
jgi:subtilisin family serine protease